MYLLKLSYKTTNHTINYKKRLVKKIQLSKFIHFCYKNRDENYIRILNELSISL